METREPEDDGEANLSGLTLVISESRNTVLTGNSHGGPRWVVCVMEAEKS